MESKESGKVRYAYGVAMALLIGGSAFSIATGPVGAQTAQNAPAALPPSGAPVSFSELAARLQPAVVNISTRQKVAARRQTDPLEELFRQFGAPVPQQQQERSRETGSLGSGFIISPDGYIVTNNHLIQGADGTGTVDEVTVTLTNRKEYRARIVGRDRLADLALLKIDAQNLPFVNWGNSERARVGDWVIAIGNPYGFGGTVTAGIISAVHRTTGIPTIPAAYDRYIQTDASINVGNSGGPMFDLNGNVIGINSALISPSGTSAGIGLAIPADLARPVIEALRSGERPQRGYLGVGLQPVEDDIASALGLPKDRGEIVRSVEPGDPAAKAGIQQGDVIVAVNGREVNPDDTVSYMIANSRVGSRIPLQVIRNGQRMTIPVVVGERPTDEQLAQRAGGDSEGATTPSGPAAPAGQTLGLSLQPMTPQIARALNISADVRGLVVTSIDPNSDAASKLQRGDVIMSVNRQPVTSAAEVAAAVAAAKRAGRSSVLLLVKRGSATEGFIGVRID